jgi:hypothetical protein
MASAPAPPANVKIKGEVSSDTHLSWTASRDFPAAAYRVYWRDTTEPAWTHWRDAGKVETLTLVDVAIDDFAFGVAGISADGFESPVVFPGAAGAFWAP